MGRERRRGEKGKKREIMEEEERVRLKLAAKL